MTVCPCAPTPFYPFPSVDLFIHILFLSPGESFLVLQEFKGSRPSTSFVPAAGEHTEQVAGGNREGLVQGLHFGNLNRFKKISLMSHAMGETPQNTYLSPGGCEEK